MLILWAIADASGRMLDDTHFIRSPLHSLPWSDHVLGSRSGMVPSGWRLPGLDAGEFPCTDTILWTSSVVRQSNSIDICRLTREVTRGSLYLSYSNLTRTAQDFCLPVILVIISIYLLLPLADTILSMLHVLTSSNLTIILGQNPFYRWEN